MRTTPLERRTGLTASICIVALLATWASYFAVYTALPSATPLAHWGLFMLALGSTAGLIVTLERVLLIPQARSTSASTPTNDPATPTEAA